MARGLPFRDAHEVTGRIVRDLVDRGRDFSSLSLGDWRRYHQLFDDGILKVITPEAAVRARLTPQSTHPDAVARALGELRAWLRAG